MATKSFPDLPPVWLAGFFAAVLVLNQIVPGFATTGLTRIVSTVVMVLGFVLVAWAGLKFGQKETPIHPGSSPKTLLVEGPFRINRNPIYTGMALMLGGFSIGAGSFIGVVLVPVFIGIITQRFVLEEEALLREAFGQEAEDYIAATRRW